MKLLFTDLDNTFLDDGKNVPPENRAALEEMLAQGHKMIISTGRSLPSAMKQAKRLGLDIPGCYCIVYNGAVIYDFKTGEKLFEKTVPIPCAQEVYRICKGRGVQIQVYDDIQVISPEENADLKEYCRRVAMIYRIQPDIFETLDFETDKLLAIDFSCSGVLREVQKEINAAGKGRIDTFFSCPELLEIVGKGVSKGAALKFMCDYLNVDIKESVACGDAENDIPMLEAAGVGACMCNGDEMVKTHADYVTTLNNNEGGVAEVIRRFILNK